MNFNVLPDQKTFRQLFIPYFLPYAVYVLIESIPIEFLSPEIKQILKGMAAGIAMAAFYRSYRVGKPAWNITWISILTAPIAIALWVAPLLVIHAGHSADGDYSNAYFILRTVNSTLLVAVFEELLLRVYLMQLFYQAGTQPGLKGFLDRLQDTFDRKPLITTGPPISGFSVISVTILFAAGHPKEEWLSAIFYFFFTTYLYKKTGSIWVCIFVHGITNFAIALLVRFYGFHFLW